MREIGITFLVLLAAFASFILFLRDESSIAQDASFTVREAVVVDVVDGDTYKVVFKDELDSTVLIKAYLIDAPESGQCFSAESKQYAEDTLFGQNVYVAHRKQRWSGYVEQPLLAFVFLDRELRHLWQAEAIEDGYATALIQQPQEDRYKNVIIRLERNAQLSNAGLWGVCPTQ